LFCIRERKIGRKEEEELGLSKPTKVITEIPVFFCARIGEVEIIKHKERIDSISNEIILDCFIADHKEHNCF
jgi:hypothetical protein